MGTETETLAFALALDKGRNVEVGGTAGIIWRLITRLSLGLGGGVHIGESGSFCIGVDGSVNI